MAYVGMKNLCVAPVSAESSSGITYGTGLLTEHVRKGDITYTYDESDYYGDDRKVDYIKKILDYDVTLEMTNIATEVLTALGLEEEITEGTGTTTTRYELAGEAEVPVGFGFIQTLRIDGEYTYRAYWFYKTTFSPSDMNSKTMEKNLEWGSPTIKGKGWGVIADSTGKTRWRTFEDFETEAAALAWLKTKAGIT